MFHCSLHISVVVFRIYERLQTLPLSPLARAISRCVTHYDTGQIGLKPALVEKRWLAASIVTYKSSDLKTNKGILQHTRLDLD